MEYWVIVCFFLLLPGEASKWVERYLWVTLGASGVILRIFWATNIQFFQWLELKFDGRTIRIYSKISVCTYTYSIWNWVKTLTPWHKFKRGVHCIRNYKLILFHWNKHTGFLKKNVKFCRRALVESWHLQFTSSFL